MRRKSRIVLCFAVLWVLGIAYYFYSGTAMGRKVGFPLLSAAARFVFLQDKAKVERWGSCRRRAPLCSSRGSVLRLHRRCGECDNGPARISVQEALIRRR